MLLLGAGHNARLLGVEYKPHSKIEGTVEIRADECDMVRLWVLAALKR
jgi:hypothetical protein